MKWKSEQPPEGREKQLCEWQPGFPFTPKTTLQVLILPWRLGGQVCAKLGGPTWGSPACQFPIPAFPLDARCLFKLPDPSRPIAKTRITQRRALVCTDLLSCAPFISAS